MAVLAVILIRWLKQGKAEAVTISIALGVKLIFAGLAPFVLNGDPIALIGDSVRGVFMTFAAVRLRPLDDEQDLQSVI